MFPQDNTRGVPRGPDGGPEFEPAGLSDIRVVCPESFAPFPFVTVAGPPARRRQTAMQCGKFWGATFVSLLSTIAPANAADLAPRARIALAPAEPRNALASDSARDRGVSAIPASTTWETPGEMLDGFDPGHAGSGCDPCESEACVECCDEPAHRCRLLEWWRGLWHRDECAPDCDPCGQECCEFADDCHEERRLFSGYYLRKFTHCLRDTFGGHDDCDAVECLPVCSAEGLDQPWSADDSTGWEAPPSSAVSGDRLPPGTIVIPRQEERVPAAVPESVPPQDWRSRRPARGASRRSEEVPPPAASDEPALEEGAEGPTLGPFVPSANGPSETSPTDATEDDRLARRFLSESGRLL